AGECQCVCARPRPRRRWTPGVGLARAIRGSAPSRAVQRAAGVAQLLAVEPAGQRALSRDHQARRKRPRQHLSAHAHKAGEQRGGQRAPRQLHATALAKKYPTPPASAGIIFDGDEGRLSEEAFLRDFAGDLPEAKAKVLCAVQWPFHKALLTGKTRHAAWRSKPSWYAVSTEDRTINPDLERFMAKRMGAKTIEVKASHVSLISQPDTIANLILEAA